MFRSLVRPVGSWLLGLLAGVVLLTVALVTLPRFAGWRPVTVTSGSMSPSITMVDALLVDAGTSGRSPVGSVITFRQHGVLITHRVAAVDPVRRGYWTRGDANPANDPEFVPQDAVVGRVRLVVPYAALPTRALAALPGGGAAAAGGAGAIFGVVLAVRATAGDRSRRGHRAATGPGNLGAAARFGRGTGPAWLGGPPAGQPVGRRRRRGTSGSAGRPGRRDAGPNLSAGGAERNLLAEGAGRSAGWSVRRGAGPNLSAGGAERNPLTEGTGRSAGWFVGRDAGQRAGWGAGRFVGPGIGWSLGRGAGVASGEGAERGSGVGRRRWGARVIGGVVVLGIGLGAVGLAPSSAARFTATTDTSYQLGTTTWMAFRQQVLALGPVSYWPMDETSGSVVSDAVGNNAMTYSGGPTVGMPGALYSSPGYSVGLTGTAQGTQTSTSPASLNLRGPMTVLAWVKLPATTTHNGRVVAKYAYSGTGGVSYMLALDNNTTSMRLLFDLTAGSPSRPVASVGVPSDQAWHLYAGTWDGSSVRVYRDGTPGTAVAVTGAGQLVSTTARVTVGAPGFSESVLGQIDEVAIWDRALTASEITSLYTAGTS